jgi:glycosyltransferase involved in cell wall biosynthesis
MHVAINLLGLPSSHQGGAGFYAATLVRGLATRPEVRVTVLGSPRVVSELDDIAGAVEVIAVPAARRSILRRGIDGVASLRDPRRFHPYRGAESSILKADVVHYPLSYMSGPVLGRPSVVTAVDLQHEDLPGNFSRKDRVLRRMRWHPAWRAAERVIVFSAFVRDRLIRFGLPHDTIDVVHAACHPAFYEPPKSPPPSGRYFIYPASPLPHKDHTTLLEAFAAVVLDHPDVRLILSGPIGHDWTPVRQALSRSGLGRAVVIAEHLSLSELRAHYAGAEALAFPSRYEGFGIPVLEALAAGCLAVVADAASLPELATGPGLLFEVGDAADLARALRQALEIPAADRQRRIVAGRAVADQLTSRRMVDLTLATYERALSSGRRGNVS